MRFPLDNVDNDDMEQTPSQTEHAHGADRRACITDLGRSQELDNEEAGDIADEGSGRRG